MSELVWGASRNSMQGASNASQIPSPVPAHVPISASSGATAAQHHGLSVSAIVDAYRGDNGDVVLDDDATSSSQEDVDIDIDSLETRSVRSESQPTSSAAEPLVLPSQSRYSCFCLYLYPLILLADFFFPHSVIGNVNMSFLFCW